MSGASGGLSFLGGWQVCHNLCLAVIALLSFIGISVAGMPLLFLTQYAIYFWSAAVVLLIPSIFMYLKNKACMSKNLILFNIGIVVFSIPFLQEVSLVFWFAGGLIIAFSLFSFFKNKRKKSSGSDHSRSAAAKSTVALWTPVWVLCRDQFALADLALVKSSCFNNDNFTSLIYSENRI